jgi:cobalt/nickel transport system permease protein
LSELLTLGATPAAWLGTRDPRLRVVISFAFACVILSLDRLPLQLCVLLLAATLAKLAGLSLKQIFMRLLVLEGFMLVLLLLLPFSVPGESGLRLGDFNASREGFHQALSIVLRAHAVVLALLALVGTLDPVVLGHALAQLRVPDKLVHLFLFTVRYLGVLHDEYQRLRQAMRTRGFVARSNAHTWRSLGWLLGMLLVRSLERSQRILEAMKCRGFNGRFYLMDGRHWRPGDTCFALLGILLLASLLALDGWP